MPWSDIFDYLRDDYVESKFENSGGWDGKTYVVERKLTVTSPDQKLADRVTKDVYGRVMP